MSKISDFISKHGYSYKSFILAAAIFPPAGVVWAWTRPNTPIAIRLALSVVAILPPVIVLLGGMGLFKYFSA